MDSALITVVVCKVEDKILFTANTERVMVAGVLDTVLNVSRLSDSGKANAGSVGLVGHLICITERRGLKQATLHVLVLIVSNFTQSANSVLVVGLAVGGQILTETRTVVVDVALESKEVAENLIFGKL